MAHNLQGGLFFREILAQVHTPLLTKAVQELAESKISNFKYVFCSLRTTLRRANEI